MKISRTIIISLLQIIIIMPGIAQDISRIFDDIILRIDTSEYSYSRDRVQFQGKSHLAFSFSEPEAVCEVELFPASGQDLSGLRLQPSGDFKLIDSLQIIGDQYIRFKVRFEDLVNSSFLKFSFTRSENSLRGSPFTEINLLPYTHTYLKIYPLDEELFIGEEKVYELVTNNIDNIQINNDWTKTSRMDYRITKTFNQIQLHIIPEVLGRLDVSIPFKLKRPILNERGELVFDLPPIEHRFYVSRTRLQFLDIDETEITLDDSTQSAGIEVQMGRGLMMDMQKTYRIENQEQAGGTLIAELFTKYQLTNNRVLCLLRVYNLHRNADGYLYIKDGDTPRFITNFDITPRTTIEKISIMRDGLWSENLTVYPGESIDMSIEGVGLHKAALNFEELDEIPSDTTIRGENIALYEFKVPMDVSKRRLELFNYAEPMGWALNVREYQEPRDFDFIWIDYAGKKLPIADLPSTMLTDGTIRNFMFGSDPDMIDSPDKMYGKQYLRMDITVTGRRNELIDVKMIDDIVICPGIKSPRSEFYNLRDCGLQNFDLNSYIRTQTSNLDIWSTLKIRISHMKEKYGGQGETKEFDIVLRKDVSFDIEVSFPAGLITIEQPEEGAEDKRLGQLTGISIAMLGQFTFYHTEKINVQRPYKVGAGFIALNTFNFSDDAANRDIGLVIIGSLYPTTKDVKLTFPLYFGVGYKLKAQKWFGLVGPGIRIRF
jgi:hypothetical protein